MGVVKHHTPPRGCFKILQSGWKLAVGVRCTGRPPGGAIPGAQNRWFITTDVTGFPGNA
jgi:hypothetical protein